MTLLIQADLAPTFSLAAQQNAYPLVKRILLSVSEPTDTDDVDTGLEKISTLRDIRVRLTTEPELIDPEEWLIDRLEAGQVTRLQERPLRPHHEKLLGLTEEQVVKFTVTASYMDADGSPSEVVKHWDASVLPADYWGGERRQPALLAAFVHPNTHTVETLAAKVTHLLRSSGEGSAVDGYQSNTRARPTYGRK